MPGEGIGKITADRGTDGGRKRGDETDDRRDDRTLGGRENGEGGRKDRRDHAAADKALDRPVDDHLVDIGRGGAERARQGEAGGAGGKQYARGQDARQRARQRDHDDFCDQIGCLHPGDLVGARPETCLDFRKRGGDDLNIENGHEHAEDHREERDEPALVHGWIDGNRYPACADNRSRHDLALNDALVGLWVNVRRFRVFRRRAGIHIDDDAQARTQIVLGEIFL
ncbi:hypothetical protein QE432_000379 [Agrobacterium sp. SORGH_AS 745]|nr:hypothetical protein [Agrobacterium sp. SORGH_AS_0745]